MLGSDGMSKMFIQSYYEKNILVHSKWETILDIYYPMTKINGIF